MNDGVSIADYSVVAVFFAAMAGVGVFYARRSRDVDQFFGSPASRST